MGTVITTGDHVPAAAFGFNEAQVAIELLCCGSTTVAPHRQAIAVRQRKRGRTGSQIRLICCCATAAPTPRRRTAAPRSAVVIIALRVFICMSVLLAYMDSSITNSRESTSIIIIIPPETRC